MASPLLILFLLAAQAAVEPQSPAGPRSSPIPNAEAVWILQAGLTEDVIVAAIEGRPTTSDTSPEALIVLKNAGVSDAVLRAMMAPAAPAAEPQPA